MNVSEHARRLAQAPHRQPGGALTRALTRAWSARVKRTQSSKRLELMTQLRLRSITLLLGTILTVLVFGLSGCGTTPATIGKFTLYERRGSLGELVGGGSAYTAPAQSTARCHNDEAVVGGGYDISGGYTESDARTRVVASYPNSDSDGSVFWVVKVAALNLPLGESVQFTAFAECLHGPGTKLSSTQTYSSYYAFPSDPTVEVVSHGEAATCPDGWILTGGGFHLFGGAEQRTRVEESYPAYSAGWKVTVHADASKDTTPTPLAGMAADAVCLHEIFGLSAGTPKVMDTKPLDLTGFTPTCVPDASGAHVTCTWNGAEYSSSSGYPLCAAGQLAVSGGFSLYTLSGSVIPDFGVPPPGEVAMTLNHAVSAPDDDRSWYVAAQHTFSVVVDPATAAKLTTSPPDKDTLKLLTPRTVSPFRVWVICVQPST